MALLTENNIKAELSYAYLHAVAARAGFGCKAGDRHDDGAGVDAVIRVKERLDPQSILTEFTMEIQLKATSRPWPFQENKHSFSLTIPHYDKLRKTDIGAPRFLAVLTMPADKNEWLQLDADQLICRRCVRWVSLRGAEDVDQNTTTVYIPDLNVLTPEALRDLATRTSKQEWVNYDA